MIVPLIPLFLAANISGDGRDWQYGPEVTYNVTFSGFAPALDASGKSHVTFNTTTKLACRGKSETRLSCTFRESRTVMSAWTGVGESRTLANSTEYPYPEPTVFEYNFEPGCERPVTVDRILESMRFNLVSLLFDQLAVPANLTCDSNLESELAGNRSRDPCDVHYSRCTRRLDDDDDAKSDEKNASVSMKLMPGEKSLAGEILEIKKIVNMRYCESSWLYGRREAVMRLDTSTSRITVTDSSFTSTTDTKVLFNVKDKPWVHGGETIVVTLDKIAPATGPPPTIKNPQPNSPSQQLFRSDSSDILFTPYDHWLWMMGDLVKNNDVESKA